MKARLAVLFAALVAVATSATPAYAGQERVEIEQVDTSRYPTVEVTVTAPTSLLGVTVPTADWRLLEDGTGRSIESQALRQEALSVVLVVDTSGSMAGLPLLAAKTSALSFVDRLPPGTQFSVIGFGDEPAAATEFTSDAAEIAVAIDTLQATGETALYDAVRKGIEQVEGSPGDRSTLVVLTDGGDTVSGSDLGQVTVDLANIDTTFTIIELLTGETDRDALTALADAAGGQVVGADDPGALEGIYAGIADQLANQYRIRYTSVTEKETVDIQVVVDSFGTEGIGTTEIELPSTADRPNTDAVPEGEPTEIAGPTAQIADSPGFFASSSGLWVGALAIGIALVITGFILFSPRVRSRRLESDDATYADDDGYGEFLQGVGGAASQFSERILERTGVVPSLDAALDEAGLEIRPGEFGAIVGAAAFFLGGLGTLAFNPVMGVILFLAPILLAPTALRVLQNRRRTQFADQLADTLLLFASTLRAGYGLGQAIDTIAREAQEPTSVEFGRVVLETRLGRPVDQALEMVARRMRSEDFEWVVDAVRIQHDVGGDLAEILDHVADTIRARARIRRQVRALSAEGRISATVLMILPFAIGLLVYTGNPDYIEPLFTETAGRVMLAGGGLLMVAGGLWLRKLVEPEF